MHKNVVFKEIQNSSHLIYFQGEALQTPCAVFYCAGSEKNTFSLTLWHQN